MATLICKITSENGEIRRFTAQVESVTYKAIHKRAKEMLNLDTTPFRLQYKDDEGDLITMSTDEEMSEAVGLALSCTPAVLRLTVKTENSNNASTSTPANNTPANNTPGKAETAQPNTGTAPGATPDFATLLNEISKTIPDMMAHMPAAMAAMPAAMAAMPAAMRKPFPDGMPAAKAANAAASAGCAAAEAAAGIFGAFGPGYGDANVHPGVTCDKTGMNPIVGNRYHLVGHNYDLCEAEFLKLAADEQAKFEKIPPPFSCHAEARCPAPAEARHWGVTCDKTGMSPIVGNRYHLLGHDYDLCEAEFLKLTADEQAKFEKIPHPSWGRCGGGRWGKHHGMHHGPHHGMHHGPHHGMHHKLAARFVSDVNIFDGTQVAPQMPFTKIWKIKNVGEVPWPPGTKMLFVGGDQMSAQMTVPLTSKIVLPGQEVDVAVDMVAPAEAGRYIGYWRLQGPHGKRFGQKVWCHVQVVDPRAAAQEEDFLKAQEEVANMMAKVTHDDDDDEAEPSPHTIPEPTIPAPPPAASAMDVEAVQTPKETPTEEKAATPAAMDASDGASSSASSATSATSAVMVDEPKVEVANELLAMGFSDQEMIEHVIEKNGVDLEACARDLVALNEWDTLLGDLEEMGFENTTLNKKLMVKNGGSVKRTVKDLVADPVA